MKSLVHGLGVAAFGALLLGCSHVHHFSVFPDGDSSALDASDVGDAAVDVAMDASSDADAMSDTGVMPDAGSLVPPRLIAPMSTSRMTTPNVTFAWQAVPGASGYAVQFCTNRICGSPIDTYSATGTSFTLGSSASESVRGSHLWRVGALRAGQTQPAAGAWSAVWVYYARAGSGAASVNRLINDFDGDGLADLLYQRDMASDAGSPSDTVTAWGTGTTINAAFDLHIPLTSAWSAFSQAGGVGDLDGDGLGDFETEDLDTSGAFIFDTSWFRGAASRSVATAAPVASPTIVGTVSSFPGGDLDRDGYGDLVFSSSSTTAALVVVFGSATGPDPASAVAVVGPAGCGAPTLITKVSGDVDGDGAPDIVAVCGSTHTLFVSSVDTARTPSSRSVPISLGTLGSDGVGDFNADGLSDVVYVDTSSTPPHVDFLFGSRTGAPLQAGPSVALSAGQSVLSLATAGDFDGDGADDVALLLSTSGAPTPALMRGSATTSPTVMMLPAPTGVMLFTVGGGGDFNGDGFDDFAFSAQDSFRRVFVMLGTPAAATAPTLADAWVGTDLNVSVGSR